MKAVIPSEYVEGYMIGAAARASKKWTTPQAQADLKRFILPLVGRNHDDFVVFKEFSNARFQKGLLEQLFAEAEAVHGANDRRRKGFSLRSHAAALLEGNLYRSLTCKMETILRFVRLLRDRAIMAVSERAALAASLCGFKLKRNTESRV
ncbi:hypothetical protein IAG25_34995 [Caballeronia sp. EK]|uniref:hypothetical protein n=1 Tax=Caballeronia sp. EK TaxID=2767469 RepID=UPI001654C76E|nr:hypothetical protein [Caballeronia sp. EK]MBC8642025.1 hypothetical protein [Caballeronia sp. EK]